MHDRLVERQVLGHVLAVALDEVEILAAVAFDLVGRFFLVGGDGRIDQPAAAFEERLAADLADVGGGDVFVVERVVVADVAAEVAATGRSQREAASLPRKLSAGAAEAGVLAVCRLNLVAR